MQKTIYRPQEPTNFQAYVFDELLPGTYDTDDLETLENKALEHEAIVYSIDSQLTSLREYTDICRAGIDEAQVKSLTSAKSAHTVAARVLRSILESEQRRNESKQIARLENQIQKLHNRLNNGAAGGGVGPVQTAVSALGRKVKQHNLRAHWLEERMERLILLLAEGKADEVKKILWYWQNRADTCGTLRFDEYLEANGHGKSEVA